MVILILTVVEVLNQWCYDTPMKQQKLLQMLERGSFYDRFTINFCFCAGNHPDDRCHFQVLDPPVHCHHEYFPASGAHCRDTAG